MELLFLLPLAGAATGWLIISLCLKALFWPRRPQNIAFNLTVQGLIPQKREQLAAGIAEIAEGYLRSAAAREQGVAPEIIARLTDTVAKTARDRAESKMPVLVPGPVRLKIAGIIEDIIRRETPLFITALADNMQQGAGRETDFSRWISNRIMEYDLLEAENTVLRSREARILKLAAAAVGFLSGLLQLAFIRIVLA